jgi:hypothetical protein
VNILIATTPGREIWLRDCVSSFNGIRTTIISDFGWEIDKIKWAYDNTNWEKFWFIHDSCVILNTDFLYSAWKLKGSVAVTDHPVPFGHYLGIYSRKTLKKLGFPEVRNKHDAIKYECDWHIEYKKIENFPVLFNNFNDEYGAVEFRNNRLNVVLENRHLKKYKGSWLCGDCVGKAETCTHIAHVGSLKSKP